MPLAYPRRRPFSAAPLLCVPPGRKPPPASSLSLRAEGSAARLCLARSPAPPPTGKRKDQERTRVVSWAYSSAGAGPVGAAESAGGGRLDRSGPAGASAAHTVTPDGREGN